MVLRASLASAPFALPVLATVVALAGAVAAACSSSGSAPAAADPDAGGADAASSCQAFVPPSSFDPTSPTVSFTNDVLPIFELSCAFSSCHGSPSAPQGGVYLGTDGAKDYANLVGVPSTDLPTMDRVKPGDAANSYLLRRIQNDACTLPGCTTAVCSELMPQGGPALPLANQLTIRAWVVQGAVSDLPDAGPSADAGPTLDDAGDAASDATADATSDAGDASGD